MAHKILAIIALLALLLTTIPVTPVYASDIVDPIILEDTARPEELTPIKRMEPIQAPDRVAQVSISWRSAQGFTIIQPEMIVPQMFQTPILEGIQHSTSIRQQALSNGSASPDITQCIVTTSNDSGSGSLRQCLLTATDGTVISFHPQVFPPSAPMTISLLSDLPWLTKAIAINGSNAGVILNGSASTASYGLVISDTAFAVISGIQITNFPLGGIVINNALNSGIFSNLISGNSVGIWLIGTGTSNNQIAANYIWGNSSAGIILMSGANKNIIGGDLAGAGNLISGNGVGIQIQNAGTVGNQVQANYIGVDPQGVQSLANGRGVVITDGTSQNLIGGDKSGTGNLISGNIYNGIEIYSSGADENKIWGNFIGTNAMGTAPIPNGANGVLVANKAQGNLIGGDLPGQGNLISGNTQAGVLLQMPNTKNNKVQGNLIGSDVTGTKSLSNGLGGVGISLGASNNLIGGDTEGARNLVSGNRAGGVVLEGNDTTANSIVGNYIGTDISGMNALTNSFGIGIGYGASNNTIGGLTEDERNLISSNSDGGIVLGNAGTQDVSGDITINGNTIGNLVIGNYVGTDKTGLGVLSNGGIGILITTNAMSNTIGGNTPAARNLISGNNSGIQIQSATATGNKVIGNFIGTDKHGEAVLKNGKYGIQISYAASNNIIGGDAQGEGNLIVGHSEAGILLSGANTTQNRLMGNYVGTNINGTVALSNTNGIFINLGASENIIGGDTPGARNLISGNSGIGIGLANANTTQNKIIGNYVGTTINGTAALSNSIGIFINLGASGNIIGGDTPGTQNLISGNDDIGIQLVDAQTTGNQVLGNIIGADITGKVALSNGNYGVLLMIGANANIIGGNTPAARNLISGNGMAGVVLQDSNTTDNQILGNIIGADVDGETALKNGLYGVAIMQGANENTIGGTLPGARNLISGNGEQGIALQDPTTQNNKIVGNFIGTDIHGEIALKNGQFGVAINGASNNVIGGDIPGSRNLISGNGEDGIRVQGSNAISNTVLGNYIGTDLTGTSAIPNKKNGVAIGLSATNNVISGNLISGNGGDGLALNGQGTKANIVLGNYIGIDVTGNKALGNQSNGVVVHVQANENIIGGEAPGARNLISGNKDFGVVLFHDGTTKNKVQGNYIGTNISGTLPISNSQGGIIIALQASENSIGGEKAGEHNLISGNGWHGITIQGTGTIQNQVLGNYIGTTSTGAAALGNAYSGIIVAEGASANFIGGNNAGKRNLISGNGISGIIIRDFGTTGNRVQGNYIGTDISGTIGLCINALGILILNGASNNFIGGNTPEAHNLISGNGYAGIGLRDARTSNNQIQGNYIGSNSSGTVSAGNQAFGIIIGQGVSNNTIGGSTPSTGNLISGNNESGIELQDAGTVNNKILGNAIGVDLTGKNPLANGSHGVHLGNGAGPNTVGPNNTIGYNGAHGIAIEGSATIKNTITRNIIYFNTLASIKWISDVVPIDLQSPFTLTAYSTATLTLSGHACNHCMIEVFAHPKPKAEGIEYLGSTTSDANGDFMLTLNAAPSFQYVSITATNTEGTTSEFSASINLADPPHSDALQIYLPMIIR